MAETSCLLVAFVATGALFHPIAAARGWGLFLAVVPAIALGSLSLVTFTLLSCGLPLHWLSLSVGFLVVICSLKAIDARWQREEAREPAASRPTATFPKATWVLVAATAIFLAWAGGRWIEAWPHGSSDAVNIWTSRALLLARADGELPQRLAEMRRGHPGYPLFLPTVLAAQYRVSGSESSAIAQITSVTFFGAALVAVWGVVRRFTGPGVSALATLALAVNPLLVRWAFVHCADVPLAYLFLLSAAGVAALAVDDTPLLPPGLTGFVVGMLMWVKNEGTVAAGLLMILGAGIAMARRRPWRVLVQDARRFALGVLPAATALVLFRLLWTSNVSTPSFLDGDVAGTLLSLERWGLVVTTAFHEGVFAGQRGVSGIVVSSLALAVVVFLFGSRSTVPPAALFLLAAITATGGAYLVAYVLSPYDVEWHITTSVDRLLLQLTPTLVAASAIVLGDPAPCATAGSASPGVTRSPPEARRPS